MPQKNPPIRCDKDRRAANESNFLLDLEHSESNLLLD
jgi:hypothetical protein